MHQNLFEDICSDFDDRRRYSELAAIQDLLTFEEYIAISTRILYRMVKLYDVMR